MHQHIVAGFSGYQASLGAAHWAAREAESARLPLRLVYALEGLPPGTEDKLGLERRRCLTQYGLRHTAGELSSRHPRLEVEALHAWQPRLPALLEATRHADCLVIGNMAPSTLGGFLTGSLTLLTAAHAEGPVVLVRPGWETTAAAHTADARPVVLGLDPAHHQDPAIAFAFEAALRHHSTLRVVHAWWLPVAHALAPISPATWEEDEAAAYAAVRAVLRPWREKYPQIRVKLDLRHGDPRPTLCVNAARASLTVVGRGPHTTPRPHLGPVTHTLIRRATSPVAVVPHG
ncbi:universal stress protein [Streptomyces sp. ODS28]|uniref:universal stress protein n=1 Tax=Streptomyces sp. ODS28 TaxID=3136688 RepID=UPI0031F15B69